MAPSTPTERAAPAGIQRTRVALKSRDGQPCIDLTTGLLAPRVVRRTATGAEVALVATMATLLGGDAVHLDLEVGDGLRLDVHDVAGTVAHHGRGRRGLVGVRLRVGPGATLTWTAEPLVVAEGADVLRTLDVEVEEGGRLLLRDTVALGRVGERGGALRCRTTISYGGSPALVEELVLDPDRAGAPGMLGDARVVATMTAIGWRPEPVPGTAAYRLEAPGTVSRLLVRQAHEAPVAAVWEAWLRGLGQVGDGDPTGGRRAGNPAGVAAAPS